MEPTKKCVFCKKPLTTIARDGEKYHRACVTAYGLDYDPASEVDAQAAALRRRLETIEAALTGGIAFARLWVGYSPTPFEVLNAVDAAELALKPEQPALCGDREGECVCNLPKSHDGNHEDCVEGQETVGWENVPAPRRRWWCEEGGDG